MSFWSAEHLKAASHGRWRHLPQGFDLQTPVAGVSTDTRAIKAGQMFIALTGERYDGHDYLTQAAAAGARVLMVRHDATLPSELLEAKNALAILGVDDTLLGLQKLAKNYRDALGDAGVKVIVVGGSNGKTTTRHLICSVLQARLQGTQSPKSFNNHIGVPLTLLAADEADDFVVVEAGTNHPGELALLGDIARPDVYVITSIGREHLAYFHDLQGVAREETAMFPFIKPHGLAILPGQASQKQWITPHLPSLPESVSTQWFASHDMQGQADLAIEQSPSCMTFTDPQGLRVTLPLSGRHNVDNALAAIAIARAMGLGENDIARALAKVRPVPMRMETVTLGQPGAQITLINDAYNANPDSMRAALVALLAMQPAADGRRVAILGDMLELGDHAPQAHRELGQSIAELDASHLARKSQGDGAADGFSLVMLAGKLAMFAAGELARGWHEDRFKAFPAWDEQAMQQAAAMLRPGDVVLLKASRGMALEKLLPHIEAALGSQASQAAAGGSPH